MLKVYRKINYISIYRSTLIRTIRMLTEFIPLLTTFNNLIIINTISSMRYCLLCKDNLIFLIFFCVSLAGRQEGLKISMNSKRPNCSARQNIEVKTTPWAPHNNLMGKYLSYIDMIITDTIG